MKLTQQEYKQMTSDNLELMRRLDAEGATGGEGVKSNWCSICGIEYDKDCFCKPCPKCGEKECMCEHAPQNLSDRKDADRKQRQRDRMREAGFVRMQFAVHVDDQERVKKYIAKLKEKHLDETDE